MKKKKKSILYMSHKAEGGFGSCPVTQKPTQFYPLQAESVARMILCKAHLQTLLHMFESFIQMHSSLWRVIYLFLAAHGYIVYLWVLFVGSSAHVPASLEQPCCEWGVRDIFLAPNHSAPSAWWSLLINHVTMFHNLGITASMSPKTICALFRPAGSQTLWLRS